MSSLTNVEQTGLFGCFGTIYLITNKINNKIYIGQTTALRPQHRWNQHKSSVDRKESDDLYYLGRAMKKYGNDNFSFEVIHGCTSQADLDYWEIYYIQKYNSKNPDIGYNLRSGGSRGSHTEKTKEKLRAANLGKVLSYEHKKKLSESHIGKVHTDEWKNYMSEIMSGRQLSEEHCRLISEGKKGIKFSDEHKKNISISKSGENSPSSKLNWNQVNEARSEYKKDLVSIDDLAIKYNVHHTVMRLLIYNETWIDPNYDTTIAKNIANRNKIPTGERNSQAILTWNIVNQIRADFLTNPKLTDSAVAKKYNMSRPTISLIRRNKTWYDKNYVPIEK